MGWAELNNGYFLSELDEVGEAAGAAGALGAAAGFASLFDEADASTDEPDEVVESLFAPESLLLSFSLEDCGLAWL
jgi:hypothetical protein